VRSVFKEAVSAAARSMRLRFGPAFFSFMSRRQRC
jgi:hypothetical protein